VRKPGSLIIRMRERSLRKVQVDDGFVLMIGLSVMRVLNGCVMVEKRRAEDGWHQRQTGQDRPSLPHVVHFCCPPIGSQFHGE